MSMSVQYGLSIGINALSIECMNKMHATISICIHISYIPIVEKPYWVDEVVH